MSPVTATQTARRFGIPEAYTDLDEMLSKEEPDIVDVCTPPHTHAQLCVRAMEDGAHVLVEKPMALTVRECDEMIGASEKNRVKLSVVHNQRFYRPFLKAREMVENGLIGNILGMRILMLTCADDFIVRENHWVHKLPGGVVSESGAHPIYLSQPFIGRIHDVSVSAIKSLKQPWILSDTYFIHLVGEFATSQIILSHASNYQTTEIDVFGTDRMIRMDLQSMLIETRNRTTLTPLSVASSSLNSARKTTMGIASNSLAFMSGRTLSGHEFLIKKFVQGLTNNTPLPVSPGEGRETVRVLQEISSRCATLVSN